MGRGGWNNKYVFHVLCFENTGSSFSGCCREKHESSRIRLVWKGWGFGGRKALIRIEKELKGH